LRPIFGHTLVFKHETLDLVGSEYIRDIHFYGRTIGKRFWTIGGKVVHLGEVFTYVALLQKKYGLSPDQLEKLAELPDVSKNGGEAHEQYISQQKNSRQKFYDQFYGGSTLSTFLNSQKIFALTESNPRPP
jgi:hypothetical protein